MELLIALVGGIFIIIATLLGYHLSLKVAATQAQHAEKMATMNALRIAGAKLRAAFASEIAKYDLLISDKDRNINIVTNMFKEALPKHAAAIEEYRPFVPSEKRAAYKQAWENYKSDFLEYYDTAKGGQSLLRQRTEAIFNFTET